MKSYPLFFVLALCTFLLSCEDEDEPTTSPIYVGGYVYDTQLAKVYAEDIPVPDRYFEGTFGGVPVSLGRIGADTLIFLVPEMETSKQKLIVKLGNQTRTWELEVYNWFRGELSRTNFEKFLTSASDLQAIISQEDKLKGLAVPFSQWIEFFTNKYSALSESEKDYLSGVLQVNQNYRIIEKPELTFEVPCINAPSSSVASMAYFLSDLSKEHWESYSYLPKNKVNEAALAGIGLAFWYQKLLMENYSIQILQCPVLQEIKILVEGNEFNLADTLFFESKVRKSFETIGVFKLLSQIDMNIGNGYSYGFGFQGKEKYSREFSDLIKGYVTTYNWDLPLLDPNSIILPPADESPTFLGPIQEMQWDVPSWDNEAIRMVNYQVKDSVLSLVLDTEKVENQSFRLNLTVAPSGSSQFKREFIISSELDPGCSLDFEVLMKERTHFLDILEGIPPYQIDWSNGVQGELSQTLPPGDYNVKVKDSEGCERIVSFISPEFGTVEDIDGNVYETVKVGDTWWMTENLRTTRLNNGTPIAYLQSDAAWSSTEAPGYSFYNNDPVLEESFGKIYNYYAACCDICPTGWRLPLAYVTWIYGSPYVKYIRSVDGWPEGSLKANNQSGLQFLPAGGRNGITGAFEGLGEVAVFWTSAKDPGWLPYFIRIDGDSEFVPVIASTNQKNGLSVRCVK